MLVVAQHPGHVGLQLQEGLVAVALHHVHPWRLHPLRVMHVGSGLGLRAEGGVGGPAGVEEDKENANVVFLGDVQK
jgi:hypothetical protein